MKIAITEIPDEGLDYIAEEALEEFGASGELRMASPVRCNLRIEKAGAEVVVRGVITADAELVCSRCLRTFISLLEAPVEVVYRPASELRDEDKHELMAGELETGFYVGNELDMGELFNEQMLLSVPIKPLCSDSCKGICPGCGADLNEGGCKCGGKGQDKRLEKLKEYFERRKG
ncbi:MAG: DUF177 domain-containing protein [Thermodesulfovibrionales bacterium]|nr:DUF177 domain-containing protein [Thermodesulfovibrionales bacterium]